MTPPSRRPNRRQVLIGSGAALAAASLAPARACAEAGLASWRDLALAVTGGTEPAPGRIRLELPANAADGSSVLFTVTVDSPMTADDHVRVVHVLATGNRLPQVASYFFSPLNGRAWVRGFLRLSGSQEVAAIAGMNDGGWFYASRPVAVQTSRCAI